MQDIITNIWKFSMNDANGVMVDYLTDHETLVLIRSCEKNASVSKDFSAVHAIMFAGLSSGRIVSLEDDSLDAINRLVCDDYRIINGGVHFVNEIGIDIDAAVSHA